MGGIEACRLIMAQHVIEPPRVVFLTAHATEKHRAEAKAAGGKDFLTKPFCLAKIDNFFKALSRKEATGALYNPQTSDGACMLPGLECVPSEAMLYDL